MTPSHLSKTINATGFVRLILENPLKNLWNKFQFISFKSQVDLRHQEEEQGNNVVSIGVDLSEFYMSVEWDILAVPAKRNVKYYTCCDEPYLDITFNITMRRKTLFYTVNLIIPCMGISFLTVLVNYPIPSSSLKIQVTSKILYLMSAPILLWWI